MNQAKSLVAIAFGAALHLAPALAQPAAGAAGWHHPISSTNAEAQRHFDRGLLLAYGFNHAGAEAEFRAAAKLDPSCAICYWGAALVAGPNINAPMAPEAVATAWADLEKARELAPQASPAERDYIAALGARYAQNPPEDRAPLDQAYAEAMRALAAKYPDDADAQTLFAEALMDLHPWDFWVLASGEAQPWTGEILALLEQALERWPQNPGANHFYIHLVEASKNPGRAMAAADRLRDLAPDAGHLVHMPAHIYQRVGRYSDSAAANRQAIEADRAAAAPGCHGAAVYQLAYVPHNYHFLWAALIQEGNGAEAAKTSRELALKVDAKAMREPGLGALQLYFTIPYFDGVRFGRWAEILGYPEPAPDLIFPRAIRHFARGLALLRGGRQEEAEAEYGRLAALAADPLLEGVTIWEINRADQLAKIAVQVLGGEIALARGDGDRAIRQLERAVELEDALRYDEPPTWPLSARHNLGAAQLALGKPGAAEVVYLADLERQPENGWSLHGLADSLAKQDRPQAAKEVEARLAKAFARADVKLEASRF
jgi:hypothetical protein